MASSLDLGLAQDEPDLMSDLIKLQGLGKLYQTGGTDVRALWDVDLTIPAGHFVAIMGASGSGKSTLLNMLGLLDRPTHGSYLLQGEDVAWLDDDRRSEIRCRKVGIIFQSFNLFPHFSVVENVCVPMRYARLPRRKMYDRAHELLSSVGLEHRLHHRPTQLSGGECQRVAIARALANNPPVLLADEPTGNLDEQTGLEVMGIFHDLVAQGRTVIMVTHNPEYEAEVERVIRIHDGRIQD